jgi:predicted permease
LERLQTTPGVLSAAQVLLRPIGDGGWDEDTWAEGSTGKHINCFFNRAGPNYFRTMRTPFVSGRDFNDHDTLSAPEVAIINEAFAGKIFGGVNPLGRSFRLAGPAGQLDPIFQVVGVVRNTKYFEIREDFLPTAFFPIAQDDNPRTGTTFVVRSAGSSGAVLRSIKSEVAQVHPGVGIEFHNLSAGIQDSLLRDRLMAMLAGAFGILAGMLATLGLYGVISYMVTRRRNEIGVRLALGADRGRVVALVLREAVLLLAVGLVIGTGLALWVGQAATALLFRLKPYDPPSIAGAALLLSAVALLASGWPALQASRLDPMSALREE